MSNEQQAPERIRVCVRAGKEDWIGVAYAIDAGDPSTIHEYIRADIAATRMRDACVNAIKSLRAVPRGAAYNNAVIDAIHKVESVTLDQVEQEKR